MHKNIMKTMSLNVKVIDILFYALDATKFNKVLVCKSIKEVSIILQTTHGGTSQVKKSKIELLLCDYEFFR